MLRFSANISTMFTEMPLLDRFAAAADAGFAAVEMQFPFDIAAERLAAARTAANVEVVLVNIPAGRIDQGELGLACLPDRPAAFQDAVALAAEYCAVLECPRVNCLAGKPLTGQSADLCWDILVENIGHAAEWLAERNIGLLVEALNREDQPHFLLNSLELADRLIAHVDHPNLALQYDVYHARANGDDWLGGIAPRLPLIGHIQFSDYPGRGAPGTGDIDFAALFRMLETLPYKGWTGCEYAPAGPTIDSLGWYTTLQPGLDHEQASTDINR